jgi:hypothetical protein
MQVYTALMLDENEVANHNCPTLLLASRAQELRDKVREHVSTHWLDEMGVTASQVSVMGIDDINEVLCDSAPHLFVHAKNCEV